MRGRRPDAVGHPTPTNPASTQTNKWYRFQELLSCNDESIFLFCWRNETKHQTSFTFPPADAGNEVVVNVSEVTEFGDFKAALVDLFEAPSPAVAASGGSASVEKAFLEVGEGPFRVLVVNEDDSAMMVSAVGVDWVREEALAAVDQVQIVVYGMGFPRLVVRGELGSGRSFGGS